MTTVDSIVISADLLWLNRNNQVRVAANIKRALNGAPQVQQTIIPAGHAMELGTKSGWIARSEFEQLQAHAASTLTAFTLAYEGTDYNVVWDNTQGAPITGEDVFDEVAGYPQLTNVTLKFLTV
ncbi:hypothetical protein [Shewanella mangrovisoli]|uniref:hypothetical protein n=1 Tax=Shewanella mangrovisoli TaxID=2864211 RepID=UPI001C654A2E|nr:hypothetical protein [Shewanella mangrovisoli]QYK07566.1 hypothetical protein K0H60_12010 [Shewanella mangrovisoli]